MWRVGAGVVVTHFVYHILFFSQLVFWFVEEPSMTIGLVVF